MWTKTMSKVSCAVLIALPGVAAAGPTTHTTQVTRHHVRLVLKCKDTTEPGADEIYVKVRWDAGPWRRWPGTGTLAFNERGSDNVFEKMVNDMDIDPTDRSGERSSRGFNTYLRGEIRMQVWEEDGGLNGGDDLIGEFVLTPGMNRSRQPGLQFRASRRLGGSDGGTYDIEYTFSARPDTDNTSRYAWSSAGPVRSHPSCLRIVEAADPHTWNDNFFCGKEDEGLQWSSAGPIAGLRCTQVHEAADPHTWDDNYLCTPPESRVRFAWNNSGPLAGQECVQWYEAADPHTWADNYLCWTLAQ